MTVSFRHFWPEFEPEEFFLPLVERALGTKPLLVPAGSRCDLEIVSVVESFSRSLRLRQHLKRSNHALLRKLAMNPQLRIGPSELAGVSIWYTGENIRPNPGIWDRTWSFEPNSRTVGNLNFPIWWLQFPEIVGAEPSVKSTENRLGKHQSLVDLTKNRSLNTSSRRKFCCTFVNWSEPGREALIQSLSQLGEVDVFGRLGGREVPNKQDVAADYKFILCAENDAYPGYVTEKLFDAWGTGCVPIWMGIDRQNWINPKAVVNSLDYPSLDDLLDAVAILSNDIVARERIVNAPLLQRLPDTLMIERDLRMMLEIP